MFLYATCHNSQSRHVLVSAFNTIYIYLKMTWILFFGCVICRKHLYRLLDTIFYLLIFFFFLGGVLLCSKWICPCTGQRERENYFELILSGMSHPLEYSASMNSLWIWESILSRYKGRQLFHRCLLKKYAKNLCSSYFRRSLKES